MMTYKNYNGSVSYDDAAEIFHGEVIGLNDVITFQGRSVTELKRAFRESVDDYLAFCRERKEQPEKPISGTFTLRVSPDLHRRLIAIAKSHGQSLNGFVTAQLAQVA
ncbi:MAG: type II toxin-antitoxin system HicB family antitoxin [Verrucomicrobiales bacterium]|jgi:predicted HicB family RNase H-like nuclease|nr:type II toxin-antitoxin system HicB family antitoxin [Verrucomicrobiales bacterium]